MLIKTLKNVYNLHKLAKNSLSMMHKNAFRLKDCIFVFTVKRKHNKIFLFIFKNMKTTRFL